MTKETKQDFTLRISQANKTQMVVIIYEILEYYLNDAEDNLDKKEINAFHESIRNASSCIRELNASINFDNPIAGNLLGLYVFCQKQLAKADLHHSKEGIQEVRKIIHKLYESYKESVKDDKSPAVMGNTEKVYAGLTYGKQDIIVHVNSADKNRGFTV